jgi:hypothetical protein
MNIQSLLESSNQYKVIADDAKKLSKKWIKSGLLEGISNETDRNTLSMLLENQAKQLITEASSTGTGTVGGGAYGQEAWNGVALPLVRRVFGEIAAKEFVSVQPMNLPSGLVFYLDFKYGTNDVHFPLNGSLYGANATTNVTDITSESLYGPGQFGYSINNFSASITAVTGALATWADFNFDSDFSASSANNQWRKLLVPLPTPADQNAIRSFFISGSILSGSTNVGGFTAATISSTTQGFTTVANATASFIVTSSLFFSSGSVTPSPTQQFSQSNFTQSLTLFFSVDPTTYGSTGAQYRGDFEDASTGGGSGVSGGDGGYPNNLSATGIGASIPEINVQLKSEAIVAKTRKLKAQWTPEFAQDLNAYHSVDAEAELTGILSQYISMEIDLELLDMLIQNAFTVDAWSAVNNTTIAVSGGTGASTTFSNPSVNTAGFYNTQGGWFQTLGTKLQKVSNKIHQLTLRGGANFLVCSPTVATVLESIPGFAADGTGEKLEYNFGIQKIGSLNSRYKVYKNPYMTENVILMGYKGAQFLECGAVFAPYVPLIMTPLLYDPSTFTPRKGLMTRYAKKMIRPDYYGKIYVSGLNTI